jgi:hypothetical protein
MMPRKIFAELMGFFPKRLKPFKIEIKFKLDLLPGFLIQIILGVWISSTMKVVPFEILYYHTKFGKFWTARKFWFLISKFEPWRVFG